MSLIIKPSYADRITVDPALCNGKPTVRGMRITVQTVLEYLSAGESREEILRQFPMLEPEDVSACLAFASSLMDHRYSVEATLTPQAKPTR
jgi:uncharacterized protein (DUF433 family)